MITASPTGSLSRSCILILWLMGWDQFIESQSKPALVEQSGSNWFESNILWIFDLDVCHNFKANILPIFASAIFATNFWHLLPMLDFTGSLRIEAAEETDQVFVHLHLHLLPCSLYLLHCSLCLLHCFLHLLLILFTFFLFCSSSLFFSSSSSLFCSSFSLFSSSLSGLIDCSRENMNVWRQIQLEPSIPTRPSST